MSDYDISRILSAIARLETKVDNLQRDDERARLDVGKLETKVDWLQRVAFTGLGIAIATGATQLAPLIR